MLIDLMAFDVVVGHPDAELGHYYKGDDDALAVYSASECSPHHHQRADVTDAYETPDDPAVEFVVGDEFLGPEVGDELRDHEDAHGQNGEEVDGDCVAVPASAVVEPVPGGDRAGEVMLKVRGWD